jgi:hypothetical protein
MQSINLGVHAKFLFGVLHTRQGYVILILQARQGKEAIGYMKPRISLKIEYLKQLQEERGISDAALASMASLNPSQIWRVKEGRCNPGPDFIAGLLNAFPDKNFDDLFFLAKPLQVCQGQDEQAAALDATGTE